jgi:LacI family transcriptional regulator
MGITIKQIAELCGVSPGTVDRALNNRTGISEKTKQRILEVARAHRYVPDHRARSLARGRTMTIGVVLFDLYNRSFAQLTNAIERRARELGYVVHLTLTGKNRDLEKTCIRQLVERKVDGIILFPVNKGPDFEAELASLDTPVVTVCNYLSDRWPYVGIDDRKAMNDAACYMIGRGYRRFIYICPPLAFRGQANIFTQEQRWNGFADALRDSDCASVAQPVVIRDKHYVDALRRIDLREAGPGRTAIVCSCDAYALEVMNFLKTEGIRVPEDVGVMGFDNIDTLQYVTPRLTTVHYDMEEFGERAVDCLAAWIEGEAAPDVPLSGYRIVEGETI